MKLLDEEQTMIMRWVFRTVLAAAWLKSGFGDPKDAAHWIEELRKDFEKRDREEFCEKMATKPMRRTKK